MREPLAELDGETLEARDDAFAASVRNADVRALRGARSPSFPPNSARRSCCGSSRSFLRGARADAVGLAWRRSSRCSSGRGRPPRAAPARVRDAERRGCIAARLVRMLASGGGESAGGVAKLAALPALARGSSAAARCVRARCSSPAGTVGLRATTTSKAGSARLGEVLSATGPDTTRGPRSDAPRLGARLRRAAVDTIVCQRASSSPGRRAQLDEARLPSPMQWPRRGRHGCIHSDLPGLSAPVRTAPLGPRKRRSGSRLTGELGTTARATVAPPAAPPTTDTGGDRGPTTTVAEPKDDGSGLGCRLGLRRPQNSGSGDSRARGLGRLGPSVSRRLGPLWDGSAPGRAVTLATRLGGGSAESGSGSGDSGHGRLGRLGPLRLDRGRQARAVERAPGTRRLDPLDAGCSSRPSSAR